MSWKKAIGYGVALAASPLWVLAAAPNNVKDNGSDITTTQGFFDAFCVTMNWVFSFVLVFAVISFLYGAITFFLANADEQKVKSARWFMFWGLIGVAIAFLARSFVLVVGNFVGASITTLGC